MSESAPKLHRFAGEKLHALDEKKRITVPAQWRKLEKTYYLHAWPSYITMTPPDTLESETARMAERQQMTPEQQRVFEQMHFSSAREVTVDAQGRVVLPDDLCVTAGLETEVMMAGAGTRIEVWRPEKWTAFKRANEEMYRRLLKTGGG